MPRVLIPETAKPYVQSDGRPVVTGGSKKAIFETLPNLLKLGEAIGGSQAVGALANVGEDILSSLSGMGGAIEQRKLQEAAALAMQPEDKAAAPAKAPAVPATVVPGDVAPPVRYMPQGAQRSQQELESLLGAEYTKLSELATAPGTSAKDMGVANRRMQVIEDMLNKMRVRSGKPDEGGAASYKDAMATRRAEASAQSLAQLPEPAPAAPAPVAVDDSGERLGHPSAGQPVKPLRAADLPKQTNEGVPPTEETEFYSVTRGLPPIPAPGAAPTAQPATPAAQLVVPRSREEVFAAAALADTPAKQAAVLQGAQNLFRPRTLFERLSGDHVARGMQEIKKLFPKMADTLPRERFEHQVKRALTVDEQKAAALRQQKENTKQRAEQAIAAAKQRRDEFLFESGSKFAETKRHNRAMEAASMLAAKNAAARVEREANNSPDLKSGMGVYEEKAKEIAAERRKAREVVSKLEQEAQAASAAAAEADAALADAPRIKAGSFYKDQNAQAKDAQVRQARAAATKAAAAAAAKKAAEQYEKEWGPASPRTALEKLMNDKVEAAAQELLKRGKMPGGE